MDRMEKSFEKKGLRIKTAIPYDGGFLVHAENKDGNELSSPLFIYRRGSFSKDIITQYNPAFHTEEFSEILKRMDEAERNAQSTENI